MKIYTKKGDEGRTSLIGGTRVYKDHLRIEAYGTVDELSSHVGLVRDSIEIDAVRNVLMEIQERLFTIGASLAADPEKSTMKTPDLTENDITHLETEIDKMNEELPDLKNFILPGGHRVVSYCHIARCVCRRAERLSVTLKNEEFVETKVIKYLNRLSDYLFVLSRWLGEKFGADEVPWKPRD